MINTTENNPLKIPSVKSIDLPIFENIPQELKNLNQWVLWKYSIKTSKKTGEKKLTKVPYQVNGRCAKTNKPETWGSFEAVYKKLTGKYRVYHGIGFVFSKSDNYVGVDIDHVYNPGTGEWNAEALEEIRKLNSYSELSPSKTGAHVITIGDKPSKKCKADNWEMYKALRYFTFTGERIEGAPEDIREAPEALKALYDKRIRKYEEEDTEEEEAEEWEEEEEKSIQCQKDESDIKILNKCYSRSEKFQALYKMKWEELKKAFPEYPTPSEADQALLTLLASETQDKRQIKRLFEDSERYREEKGNDYLKRSINGAVSFVLKSQAEKRINAEVSLEPFYITPYGVTHINDKGEEKTIIRAKTEITGISDNLDINPEDTERNRYTHYRVQTGSNTLFMSHGDLLTRAGTIKMITAGMMAAEGDSKLINGFFLRSIEAALKQCERLAVCERPGWKRNKSIFVSGKVAYSQEGETEVNLLDKHSQEMYDKAGSLEGWMHPSVLKWLEYDTTRVCCYISLSGFICSLLGLPNILGSITGRTTGGKTSAAKVGGSLIGRAYGGEYIVRSANITLTAAEKLSISVNGHFLVLDETKTNKDYEPIIYLLANGRPRGRAPNSTLEESEGFALSVLFTGESDLLKETVAQGANGRLITIINKIPKTNENAEAAKDIEEVIQNHYGHIKEPFLKKVMENKDNLQKRYRELSAEFRDENRDIGARVGDIIACICLAGEMLEEVFSEAGIPTKDYKALCSELMRENITSDQKKEYWLRGLEIVYNEVSTWKPEKDAEGVTAANPTLQFRGTIGGRIESRYLDITEAAMKKICLENNLDKTELVKVWKDKGLTICDKDGKDGRKRYNKNVKIESKPVPCIRFDRTILEEVLELNELDKWGDLEAPKTHLNQTVYIKRQTV